MNDKIKLVPRDATEEQLREMDVPWPKSAEDLDAYIKALLTRPHDYGTCVYAISMAATAAFHYVASKVGATGFQAGCADLDFLRRTRGYKGPFMVLDAEKSLYPQYDGAVLQAQKFRASITEWLADEAQKKLDAPGGLNAHPNVVSHWRDLVAARPAAKTEGVPNE